MIHRCRATVLASKVAPSVRTPPRVLPPRRNFSFGFVSDGVVSLLETVHTVSATPWWLTIAGTTVAVRLALSPVMVFTMRRSAAIQQAKPQMEEFQAEIKELMSLGQTEKAKAQQAKLMQFMREKGISPFQTLAGPLLQFPVFLSFFFGLRKLVENNTSLATGGLAWFTDLTTIDPTYVLPVLTASTMFLVMELGAESGANQSQTITGPMKNILRGLCVLSIPVTAQFPTALMCYWLPSNVYSLVFGGIMRLPVMKRKLKLNDPVKATLSGAQASVEIPKGTLTPQDALRSYQKAGDSSPVNATKLLTQRPKRKRQVGEAT